MIEEEAEIPKTHSIVSTDSELRVHHFGEAVSYQGVEGWLIRYIPEAGSLMKLTLAEAFECLKENRPGN
jgi:hypothetical protein